MKQSRILQKLGIEPATPDNFKIFIASLKVILQYSKDRSLESLKDWDAPVLPNLERLNSDEIKFIESKLPKVDISINECQTQVQKLIPQAKRKRFAAYYTVDQGTRLMACVACEYLDTFKNKKIVLADPFLGSARTLTTMIQKIGTERLQMVWGIEPLPLPALVAYAALLSATKGRKDLINVIVGDAFKKIPEALSQLTPTNLPKADIILTNPPFTRWKYLEKSYRGYLFKVINGLGYGEYITRKEASLQTLSMFLSDYALNKDGLIVSVLPASTFYTIYGRGYKSLLRKNYDVLAVIECASRPSFSEDSGFKEVIIVAIKRPNRNRLTVFAELNGNIEECVKIIMGKHKSNHEVNSFNIHDLPQFLDINWLALFGENKLRDIVVDVFKQGLKNGTLGHWKDVLGKRSIIRGVEMYGPEFFFIPNVEWRILKEDEKFVVVENVKSKVRLALSKEFLIKTLRKPSLYSYLIEANVDSYMLSIPPVKLDSLPEDLQHYIKWGIKSGTAKPAINAYGKYWYSHVHRQMITKKPFGHVFIPDKVDLMFKRRGVFANYTKEKIAASKNFYIIKDENEVTAKLLAGWFNSTIFISILMLLGRKISETWTRFLENDYLELPMINVSVIGEESTFKLCKSVNDILNTPLPSFWDQLNKEYRYRLDLSIAEAIKIENPEKKVEELYQILSNHKFNIQLYKT
ncbi:MAG: restriction endonuclease subunit M [Candidatus Korarchaeota archaeon]|nr:restriction endonuclease subunit M [Thermoproteota archaeon]MCR8463344.1 restriction endonuclease subunit M [Thermoproteota archaeon]MCR8470605.1 restriction endonuclease subunit M [Thermoproteota archaeon]MCR8488847.1 restriction endonuclease subunit M [Thermoproteota archaeon]